MCDSTFWGNFAAIFVILIIEFFIGKSKKIESSSTIELLINIITRSKK